ncbi:hypothetical protein ABZV31_36625 [Streptomyces sp. NPDC005202]|uniref:hypothetical protein n=1 Tax=Streptomyces sp. NPDC005202 TaxID=3157021 RepID=UPI0033B5C728
MVDPTPKAFQAFAADYYETPDASRPCAALGLVLALVSARQSARKAAAAEPSLATT